MYDASFFIFNFFCSQLQFGDIIGFEAQNFLGFHFRHFGIYVGDIDICGKKAEKVLYHQNSKYTHKLKNRRKFLYIYMYIFEKKSCNPQTFDAQNYLQLFFVLPFIWFQNIILDINFQNLNRSTSLRWWIFSTTTRIPWMGKRTVRETTRTSWDASLRRIRKGKSMGYFTTTVSTLLPTCVTERRSLCRYVVVQAVMFKFPSNNITGE